MTGLTVADAGLPWRRADSGVQKLGFDGHWFTPTHPEVAAPPALRDGLGAVEPQAHRGELGIVDPAEIRSELGSAFAFEVLDGPALDAVQPHPEVSPIGFHDLVDPIPGIAAFLTGGSDASPQVDALLR